MQENRAMLRNIFSFSNVSDCLAGNLIGRAKCKSRANFVLPHNNACCYIASVNTKRDWLICSHVALDKCNVSRPGNK